MENSLGGLQALALEAHRRLCVAYRCPVPFFSTKDPLSELVSALLSHRTKNRDSKRAFDGLKASFPTWEAVRDAPEEEVREAISAATWPEQKAPRIQAALRQITVERGRLDLSFLADLSVTDARGWLERIPGVGPKTSAATLLFSHLRQPALPVDSHHHRVAQRVGLIGNGMGPGPAHNALAALVPAEWDAQQVYDHHEVFMLHGQKCCFWRNPDCRRCPLLDICPFGQEITAAPAAGSVSEAFPSWQPPNSQSAPPRNAPSSSHTP